MSRVTVAGGAFALLLVLLAVTIVYLAPGSDDGAAAAMPPGDAASTEPARQTDRSPPNEPVSQTRPGASDETDRLAPSSPASRPGDPTHEEPGDRQGAPSHPAPDVRPTRGTLPEAHPRAGFLYARITTLDGVEYEGRLRWGGGEEAFWGDYFNGFKAENPWASHVPPERLEERRPIEIFGFEFGSRKRRIDLGRPFMARFGDIARIEAGVADLRVTLKSGTSFALDRFNADDLADGVRVWDEERGVVDLGEWRIRSIEFLPTPPLAAVPDRLHGTVKTPHGEFTGFVQWDRERCVGTDELAGRAPEGERSFRFDAIASIARGSPEGVSVTLRDGARVALSGARDLGDGNRGLYVDDRRYGRVLISWDAFERVDFSPGDSGPGGSGPAYDDYPPGHPLGGSVTTRDGRTLTGRLVYDLDESETTETLDAPALGVTYTIPFGLIASIVIPDSGKPGDERITLTLHHGETLRLEPRGDLADANAGMLIFVDDAPRPEYLPWADVARVEFDRPPAIFPPVGGR